MNTTTSPNKPSSSGYAPVNGIDMYYEVYGEGLPLILLHGAYMTIEMNWNAFIPELSKTRKVIALELQGHGRTPFSSRPLSRLTLASDVEGLMDHLNIDTADVLGFSFGGSIAYYFAMQSPQRLRKLVIISSTYKTEGWMSEVRAAFQGRTPEQFDNTPLKTAYEAVAPDKTQWTNFLKHTLPFGGLPYNMGDDQVAKISAPVLLIAGDNDGLDKIELVKTYQLLGGAICADFVGMPKSQLAIVPGQGHVTLMQQKDTILGYLANFLGQ